MTVVKQEDLIQSVADALQFISYYHPVDFIRAMRAAYEIEESPAARAALTQVLVNSRMCALGKRPICQDTGIVIAVCGGAAYLVAKAIRKSSVVAFEELGMEAVHEFEVEEMPVTVAVDSQGNSVHGEGPKVWSARIAEQIKTVNV